MNKKEPKLVHAILFDLVGLASYIIPTFGEYTDVVWAPLSAFLFYRMFGGKLGAFGATLSFVEEALPFTDFIPTFTLGWIIKQLQKKKNEKISQEAKSNTTSS